MRSRRQRSLIVRTGSELETAGRFSNASLSGRLDAPGRLSYEIAHE
jgi:hypothetical protein